MLPPASCINLGKLMSLSEPVSFAVDTGWTYRKPLPAMEQPTLKCPESCGELR